MPGRVLLARTLPRSSPWRPWKPPGARVHVGLTLRIAHVLVSLFLTQMHRGELPPLAGTPERAVLEMKSSFKILPSKVVLKIRDS